MANEPVKDSDPTIGRLVSDATKDISTLINKEIQLAKSELQVSLKNGGTGIGLFAGAAFFVLMGLVMFSMALAYLIHWNGDGLALQWAFLIVFAFYLLVAALLGFPQNGPYNVQAARVRADQRLRSPDIYGGGAVIRDVLSLRGLIRPGNSGGPVVDSAGHVVGVVFAASVTSTDTGYALSAQQVGQAAATGRISSRTVSTQGCAA